MKGAVLMNKVACVLEQATYAPGDLPPEGYLEWHEWAEVQHKAGIKQVQCCRCGLWQTPQELSDEVMEYQAEDRRGKAVTVRSPVCRKCAQNYKCPTKTMENAPARLDLARKEVE